MLPPFTVSTREELATLVSGVGAELGVAEGKYSETLLAAGRLGKLYSIDRWSDHHDEREMRKALSRLARFGDRSEVIRATFEAAAEMFDDESFDFIYIDGYAHAGQEGGKTLAQWYPKLKSGGIFAGHDYCSQYPETVKQVNRFAHWFELPIYVTSEKCFPSWITRKP